MASVWVARQIGKHGFEKQVAIKTILPEFAEDPRFQKMFLDEAHIASNIEHPNVAQILDLGEEHGVLYLVMELVDGDSLSKLFRVLEKKNLALPHGVTLRILADACAGLHAAHELHNKNGELLGVVHRDVSPQNILVSVKGIAKLIDFGVAKARDRLAGDTNAGMLKGKVHYMAPEQAVGKTIDRRADVWGIGAIAYHLLAGKPPYDGPNQLATLHRLTTGRPPMPLPDAIPAVISTLVGKTLIHEPEQRIANAHDLQVALEQAMIEAKCPTTSADVARFVREHLGDRADARRRSIEVAIAAANDRARVAEALRIDADASNSLTNLPERIAALNAASPRSEPPTAPGLPSHRREISSTSGTLATIDAPLPSPRRRRRAIVVVASISAGAALLLVFALGRKSVPETKPAAAASVVEEPKPPPPPATPPATQVTATVSAEPSVTIAKTKAAPPPKAKATVTATATATATATVKKKKKPVDDGF
jgi:eukaryotic-like serine/threonine-protein kinase